MLTCAVRTLMRRGSTEESVCLQIFENKQWSHFKQSAGEADKAGFENRALVVDW